jgi:hypothetical protein
MPLGAARVGSGHVSLKLLRDGNFGRGDLLSQTAKPSAPSVKQGGTRADKLVAAKRDSAKRRVDMRARIHCLDGISEIAEPTRVSG